MRPEERRALIDAVDKRRKDDTFERSMARQVKNQGLSYEDYIRLIADVRDLAKGKGLDLEAAAKELASEQSVRSSHIT
jgi:hypothetical protein